MKYRRSKEGFLTKKIGYDVPVDIIDMLKQDAEFLKKTGTQHLIDIVREKNAKIRANSERKDSGETKT